MRPNLSALYNVFLGSCRAGSIINRLPPRHDLEKRCSIRNKLSPFAPYTVALLIPLTCASTLLGSIGSLPVHAIEPSPVATVPGSSTAPLNDFALDPDNKEHEKERKEIEELLLNIETQWNAHNLDAVMANYAEDYVNNDGLDKKAVSALTQDFWKTYPDAKSSSKTKSIRVEGNFATIESRDMAVGSTAKEMPGINSKGDLNSISEGQLYIKKIGSGWKIIGDRIDYEKVRVAFGWPKP